MTVEEFKEVLTVLVAAVACVDPEETVQEENTVGEEREYYTVMSD